MEERRPYLPVSFIVEAVVISRIAPDREFQDESCQRAEKIIMIMIMILIMIMIISIINIIIIIV